MNKVLIIILIAISLFIVGYFTLGKVLRKPTFDEKSLPDNMSQTNPPGVVNEEIESSNYITWSKSEYEKAIAEKRTIMLYFTANWCPICREQEPVNMDVMKKLEKDPEVLAFRVHILDSETTKETEKLAEDFGVTYQHTFVILKPGGEVSFKYTGPLTNQEIENRLRVAGSGGD